jgi:endonuclease YncB( thermonuclease family)
VAFRFRRSIRLATGIRLNVGSKSASLRVGPKALGYSVSKTGKKRVSAGIPGAGLSYSQAVSSKSPSPGISPAQLLVSQSNRSSKRPIFLLLAAAAVGLLWFSAASDRDADQLPGRSEQPGGRVAPGAANSEPASDDHRTLVTTAGVRLRSGPSTSYQILLTVPVGTSVLSSRQEGSWHFISYGKHTGWIHGDHLADADLDATSTRSPASTQSQTAPPATGRKAISGRASVVDGDTVEIAGTRVRFNGIDAPESSQVCRNASGKDYRCGQSAANALDAWLAQSRPLRCEFVEWDAYGRFVGDCSRADGKSVAAWLVSSGHAMDWPRHSSGVYTRLQAEARSAQRGIWQGEFQPPWEWRAAEKAPAKPTTAPVGLLSNSCNIKGNIDAKGVRIYHMPGQKFYSRTVISAGKGERMFCSEEAARAAGWRRSRR